MIIIVFIIMYIKIHVEEEEGFSEKSFMKWERGGRGTKGDPQNVMKRSF